MNTDVVELGDLNMRLFFLWVGLLACFALVLPSAHASEDRPASGIVEGTIQVWQTKVNTVGPKSDKEVIVFLEPLDKKSYPEIKASAVMDQLGLVFIPHVLAIQKGTTVEFKNSDNDKHNVYFLYDKTGDTLDIGTEPPGVSVFYTFKDAGVVITLCKLHLEMAAYIVVLDNPFFTLAVLDGASQRGSYRIGNVPPGEYVLKTWHKKLKMKGKIGQVRVESGKTTGFDVVITKAKYAK